MGIFDDMLRMAAQAGIRRKSAKELADIELQKAKDIADYEAMLRRQQYEASPQVGYLTPRGFQFGDVPQAEIPLPAGVQGPPAVGPEPDVVPLRLAAVEKSPTLAQILAKSLYPEQPGQPKLPSGMRLIGEEELKKNPRLKSKAVRFGDSYLIAPEFLKEPSRAKEWRPSLRLSEDTIARYRLPKELLVRDKDGLYVAGGKEAEDVISAHLKRSVARSTEEDYREFLNGLRAVFGWDVDEQPPSVATPGLMSDYAEATALGLKVDDAMLAAMRNNPGEAAELLRERYKKAKKLRVDDATGDLKWGGKVVEPGEAIRRLEEDAKIPPAFAEMIVNGLMGRDAALNIDDQKRAAIDRELEARFGVAPAESVAIPFAPRR